MRRPLLFLLCLGAASLPVAAQMDETGGDPGTAGAYPVAPRAQPAGPDAEQDAEAAREKLLKASDEIDLMESNSEANKASLDAMKAQIARLQDDNTTLKSRLSTQETTLQSQQDMLQKEQDALDHMQADRVKERQALIDEVAALVAEKTPAHKVHHTEATTDAGATPAPSDSGGEVAPPPKRHADESSSLAPPPDNPPAAAGDTTPAAAAIPHPHKGYIYVVKEHETLSLIVDAYRDQGVPVTISQVRKANGLTAAGKLKVGQKLFIPKPGT